MPKIISKCCELVKLCHINRSGPVLLHTITVIVRTSYSVLSYPTARTVTCMMLLVIAKFLVF